MSKVISANNTPQKLYREKNARIETIMKVFEALGAKVNSNVELNNKKSAY